MKFAALVLALAVAAPPQTHTATSSGLHTRLERELWAAVVLLEGDVETATRALDSCERALDEVTAAPEIPPVAAPNWDWLWPVAGMALALGSGVAIGLLLGGNQ